MRECQREKMSERERVSALNGIRTEFMALAKERELALKMIRMDFCGSKCY